MSSEDNKKTVWIAMVHVKNKEGSDLLGKEAHGAFVNILAMVTDGVEFEKEIVRASEHYGLELVAIEDLERFSDRIKKFKVDQSLMILAEEVKQTGSPRFSSFHVYDE